MTTVEVIREALTGAKLVYMPHVSVSEFANRAVLKFHVAPFAADPQTKIAQLYKRCADLGVPMASIEWGAVSRQYPGCQKFTFHVKRKGEE